MADLWNVGSWLPTDIGREVHRVKERMGLDIICSVSSKPVLSRAAELCDEISCLRAQLDLRGNVQCAFPVYHLEVRKVLNSF